MSLNDSAADAAAAVLRRRAGLRIEDSMRGRMIRCLADASAEAGIGPEQYVEALDTDSSKLQAVLNRVTVQETSFFRDNAQFDALAHLLSGFRSPTTLWSAACANGQEAYSLAMLLDQAGDTESTVVASDISTDALERTRAGEYTEREISGLSSDQRRRYLVPMGNGRFRIVDDLRARIETAHVNLVSDTPPFPAGSCPVFFCRNVLIYFEQPQIVRLLELFSRWLPPEGVLFLGYSESLWQTTDRFSLDSIGSAFLYRPRSARELPASPPPRVSTRTADANRRSQRRRRTDHASGSDTAPTRVPKPPAPVAEAEPSAQVLFDQGLDATRSGDLATAVDSFRRCVYLDPEWVLAHAHLAFALEASGDLAAARRSFAATRKALDRVEPETLESALGGFDREELARLLENKMEESR